MLAYNSTEIATETLTHDDASCDMFSGDGASMFSSGLEASAADAFSGDGTAMFSSGLVQMFSSGLAPQKEGLRLVGGDGVEMFSSGL